MSFTNNKTKHSLIDALIIILHITYGMSLLKVWLLDPFQIPFRLDIFVITLFAYLGRFGTSFRLPNTKNVLFYIFIFIYIADVLQNLFTAAAGNALARIIVLLDIYVFMEYIYGIYLEAIKYKNDFFSNITVSYRYYSLYNTVVVLLCAILIILGILSPYENPMDTNSLFGDNYSRGIQYYFPGYLSVTTSELRAFSSLGIPLVTGLSHEPHVLFLLLGPAFFFFLRQASNKVSTTIVLYFSFLLLLTISTSATAIIVFLIVIIFEQFYSFFIGKHKTTQFVIMLFFTLLIFWVFSRGGAVIAEAVYEMVTDKTFNNTGDSSMGYSTSMLKYMISPHSLFGSGNIPGEFGQAIKDKDIGLISFFLDIIFFIIMFSKSYKNIISKNITCHYWGMASLYFLLHMQKLSYAMFSYPLMSFFVIMTIIFDIEKKRNNK